MASSDNQGIQIALIIFVILTVVLSITSFLFFRQYDSARMEREDALSQATSANNTARDAQAEINAIKSQVLGFPEESTLEDIQNTQAQELDLYGVSYPEVQKTYRQVLVYLHDTTLQDAQDQLNKANEDIERLKTENQEREALRQAQIKQHADAAQAAEANLRQEQAAFQQTVAGLNETNTELQQRADQLRAQLDQLDTEKTQEIAKRDQIVQNLQRALDTRTAQVDEFLTETFEVPDGLVQRVDVGTGTVYLNLGRADNLRRSVTFSVHDQESNTLEGDGRKGQIEVTQVVGDHLSIAQIIEDDAANPIVRGDFVYSPLWHPGQVIRFAFAGVMDLDGDGKSDRNAIHQLVKMHGAEIDAEVTDTGERIGQLTLDTRYLVLGDEPDEAAADGAAVVGFSQIQIEASRMGTKILSFRKFLDSIGWKDSQRVLRFGKFTDAADFLRPVPDGGIRQSNGTTTELFRRREPRQLRQRPRPTDAPAGDPAVPE